MLEIVAEDNIAKAEIKSKNLNPPKVNIFAD
jgi:hypothetical protein